MLNTPNAPKKIILLGTGGTIAGVAVRANEVETYTPATLTVEQLLAAVPQAAALQPIVTEQLFQIGSEDMTPAHWLTLAQRTQKLLDQDDVGGVVITHGTDTLEETAWFLQLVLRSQKPVVLVGAMLPANAPNADGPTNLAQALCVARYADAQSQGVLVVMQGKIFLARDVTKRFAGRIDAFTAGESMPLGSIEKDVVHFDATCANPSNPGFVLPATLPEVEIVYGYATTSRVAVDALVQAGVQGIVYAAPGSGTLNSTMRAALRAAVQRGVAVVRSSRTGAGRVRAHTHEEEDARLFVSANTLNPQKARVLLMLALQKTHEVKPLQKLFDALGG